MGRDGLDGRAHGPASRVGLLLPVRDGVRADAKEIRREVSVPTEEGRDFQDLEALGGGVVGPMTVRDLVEAGAEEGDDLPGQPDAQVGLPELGRGFGERVVLDAEMCPCGNAA